jgi:cell division inhibitor SepF
VLLQLDDAAPEEAQRIIDFIAGAVSALDGQVERIGDATFLFAPAGVTVSHS